MLTVEVQGQHYRNITTEYQLNDGLTNPSLNLCMKPQRGHEKIIRTHFQFSDDEESLIHFCPGKQIQIQGYFEGKLQLHYSFLS